MDVEIRVNLEKMTIGDLELLDRAGKGQLPMNELLDLLDRVVDGGARHLPVTVLGDIVEAIGAAVEEATRGKSIGTP